MWKAGKEEERPRSAGGLVPVFRLSTLACSVVRPLCFCFEALPTRATADEKTHPRRAAAHVHAQAPVPHPGRRPRCRPTRRRRAAAASLPVSALSPVASQFPSAVNGPPGALHRRLSQNDSVRGGARCPQRADWRVYGSKPDEDIGFHLSVISFSEVKRISTEWRRLKIPRSPGP